MSFEADLATGVFAEIVYDILKVAFGSLRRRSQDWFPEFRAALAANGAELSDAESDRLREWLERFPIDALVEASGEGHRARLVHELDVQVLGTSDATLAAEQADPGAWAAHNTARAEALAGALWEALAQTLDSTELQRVQSAVAARHTEELAASIMQELGWIHRALDELRRDVCAGLPLERALLRPLPGTAVSAHQFLWARSGHVPFDDRANWVQELTAWCEAPDRVQVGLVVGVGGMGKTRLALELCARMARRGWLAGLYRPAGEAGLTALTTEQVPRLVVIDYAEDQPDVVRDAIGRFADQLPLRANRVRVLLLVRRTGEAADPRRWFTGPQDRASQLLDAATLTTLSEQAPGETPHHEGVAFPPEARRKLFESAVTHFGHLGEVGAAVAPDLDKATYASPLFVLMAALLAAEAQSDGRFPELDADELMDRVLEREQRRHWRQCPETAGELQRRAVAIATLFGAAERAEGERLLALEPAWATDSGMRSRLAYWLHNLYEGPRWWNPLEPDLLGERLVGLELDEGLVRAAVDLPASPTAARALGVLARLAEDRPACRNLLQRVVRDALPQLVTKALEQDRVGGLEVRGIAGPLTALIRQLDVSDVVRDLEWEGGLGPAGNRLAEALLAQEVLAARAAEKDRRLALALHHWAAVLSSLGRDAEALRTAQESATAWMTLTEVDPGNVSDLVMFAASLNDLAGAAGRLGRYAEALPSAEAAVEIYQRLSEFDREAFLRHLAMSLNTLAIVLDELGNTEESLGAAQEAVDLLRSLPGHDPTQMVYLASALNTLANVLDRLGRYGEAFQAADESVALMRPLAKVNPAGRLPDLAAFLNTRAKALGRLERSDDSLAAAREAVDANRRLVTLDPDAHLSHLGITLNTLAIRLGSSGQLEAALGSASEAVDIHRSLAERNPAAFLPSLGACLNTLAIQLSALDRREAAAAAAEEGVACYRRAAEANPARRASLALLLHTLATRLLPLGLFEEAAVAAEESVAIRRDFGSTGERTEILNLVFSLRTLAVARGLSGMAEEARGVAEESVALSRVLAATDPAYHTELANCLHVLALVLSAAGEADAASAAAAEAAELSRRP